MYPLQADPRDDVKAATQELRSQQTLPAHALATGHFPLPAVKQKIAFQRASLEVPHRTSWGLITQGKHSIIKSHSRLSLHRTQFQRHFKQALSLYAFEFSAAFASAASFSNAAPSEKGLTRERPSAPNPGRVPEPPPARPAASSRLSRHNSRAETEPGRGASPTRARSPPGRGGRGAGASASSPSPSSRLGPARRSPPPDRLRGAQALCCPQRTGGLLCVRRLAEGCERLRCLLRASR